MTPYDRLGSCRRLAVHHDSFRGVAKNKVSDFRKFGFTVEYNATADAAGIQYSIIALEQPRSQEKKYTHCL